MVKIESIIKQLQDLYNKRAAIDKQILAAEKHFAGEAKIAVKAAETKWKNAVKKPAKKPAKKAAKPAKKPLKRK